MTEIIHLAPGDPPPEAEPSIRIDRADDGTFAVTVHERRFRPVIRPFSGIVSFEAAATLAREHAERLGVAAIHALGCSDV